MDFNLQAFKADFRKYGADDLASQLVHLRGLANVYKDRALHSDRSADNGWLPYVKAHGLLNSCLSRCSPEEVESIECEIFCLEEQWYGGQHPLGTVENLREQIKRLKQHLQTIRTECKELFHECHRHINAINMDSIFCEENQKLAEKFSQQVQNESEKCTQRMVEFAKVICETSEDMITVSKGKIPCSYAVLALGSMARGEATPYSDLEYAFIIEHSSHRQYFKSLAVDTYFRIGNLGETPLKYFYITELHEEGKTGWDSLWFVDKSISGFRIDGLMPIAGNIPTGNGLTDQSFTLTVDELVGRFVTSIGAPWTEGVTEDLSALLASTQLVHSRHDGEHLVTEFICQTMAAFDTSTQRIASSIKTIVTDVNYFSKDFCPKDLQFETRNLQIKTDIFRYPTILAHDLKSAMNLKGQTAWEIFCELYKKELISKSALSALFFVLASAIWIRTSAYLHTGTQKEIVSFHPVYDAEITNDRFYAPKKLYIAMMCRLIPVRAKLQEMVREIRDREVSLNDVEVALQSIAVEESEYFLQARLHYLCGDFRGGLHHIRYALEDERVTEDVSAFVEKVPGDHVDAVLLMAYLLFHDGQFNNAKLFFEHLCELQENCPEPDLIKLASFRAVIAQCLMMLGQYEASRKLFDKAGRNLGKFFGVDSKDAIPDFLMKPFPRQSENSTETVKLFASVSGKFLADSVRYHQGRYNKTRKSFKDLLNSFMVIQLLMTNEPQRNLVCGDFHMSIGLYHIQFAEYKQAMTSLTTACQIYKDVFGASAASLDLLSIHLHLATLALKRGEYTEAKNLCVLSLEILKKTGQVPDLNLLACHQTLAEVYLVGGEYDKCATHVNCCLSILHESPMEGLSFTAANVHIIHSELVLKWHAYVSSDASSSLEEAKQWSTEAINVLQTCINSKAKESHPDVCVARRVLAQICLHLREFDDALRYATMALDGFFESRGEKNTHPDILASQLVLAKIYIKTSDMSQARDILGNVLMGYSEVYGESQSHPDIADTFNTLSKLETKCLNYKKAWEYSSYSISTMQAVFGVTSTHPVLTAYETEQCNVHALFVAAQQTD